MKKQHKLTVPQVIEWISKNQFLVIGISFSILGFFIPNLSFILLGSFSLGALFGKWLYT